jgi:16S rRNA (guanine966-N2)-methyltransferase
VRVVAGYLGGRKIEAPAGVSTRPTTDRVREAAFNALGSMGVIEGALVADLYAGSGAMGIEALSRGAAHCTFIENDRSALQTLNDNVAALGLAANVNVIHGSVEAHLQRLDVDIALADPPYAAADWSDLMTNLSAPLLVAEGVREVEPIDGWSTVRTRRYGRTWVTILSQNGTSD